jgi:ubiquinone/menaquinone biosynthesis C-methylase UbiE
MEDRTRAHYERLAQDYDDNWVYNPDFIEWMTRNILGRLAISRGDRVADIGCGTGLYSKTLAEHANQVLCIDPSAGMLEQLPKSDTLIPVQATAEAIASGDVRLPYDHFDAVLVKEAIHHVRDRRTVLNGLASMLAPGGRLLVVMLPTRINYPLFGAALELFEELQPDPNEVASAMRFNGLHVDMQYESFSLTFDRSRYIQMVQARYMSLLSSFDDEELHRGIAEIRSRYRSERLDFTDRHAFILGVRR